MHLALKDPGAAQNDILTDSNDWRESGCSRVGDFTAALDIGAHIMGQTRSARMPILKSHS